MTIYMPGDNLENDERFIDMALQVKNFGSSTIPMFGGTKTSDNQYENSYASMGFVDYLEFCRAYLGQDFLTKELLQRRLQYFRNHPDLPGLLPPGANVCVVPIPCSENGFRLEEDEIQRGMFLRTLLLDTSDLAILGFSRSKCNIFKLLPVEIRAQLSFQIPAYQPAENGRVSATDRENICKRYEQVFRTAHTLFQQTKSLD